MRMRDVIELRKAMKRKAYSEEETKGERGRTENRACVLARSSANKDRADEKANRSENIGEG